MTSTPSSPELKRSVATTAMAAANPTSSPTVLPPPLQRLCNVIKAIANTPDATPHNKAVVDKTEATTLALGLAKLMKIKKSPGTSEETKSAGDLVAKHLDSDFSCFLCRKKCRTRTRFFLHFKRHLNGAATSNVQAEEAYASDSSSDENVHMQIHLRGLEADGGGGHHQVRRHRRHLSHQRRQQQQRIEQDGGDSGCHSAGGGSSSNGELTSDCPGDSESSDSDSETKKSQLLEKRLRFTTAANSIPSTGTGAADKSKNKLSLAERQLDNNETEGLVCMTCLKRFSNCQNLRRHLRLHIARDSIKPDFDIGAADNEDIAANDDGQGRYLCDWCPARFDNRSAARIHESSHRGQEPKCYVCSKAYADRYSLRYHLRTHGIGRQIRCEFCSKAFSKPSRLASHVRSHHKNIRDFACPSCDKAFKTRVHLNNHFRQHSGEKPFQCGVCHERFRHKASMLSHCRKHNGQRPYCCEICGKTFREPSTLKAHSRVHTGDKPYICNQCGKSFTQRAGLNYHKRASHDNLRPHLCRLCPFATVKLASLTAHYRNIHQQAQPTGDDDEVDDSVPMSSLPPSQQQPQVIKDNDCTPLPSFDNLKTLSSTSPTPPALTPPSSSSPAASSASSTPCLEDFLPQSSTAAATAPSVQASSDYHLPSMSDMGSSHMDYSSAGYDYGYHHRQSSMYHQHQQQQQQQPDQLMHHVQPTMHHPSHQQQTHQWFSYASQHHQHHHHDMIHSNANNTSSPSSSPTAAAAANSTYPYYSNGGSYFSSSTGSTNNNPAAATGASEGYHGFSGNGNYDAYLAVAAAAAAAATNHTSATTAGAHPSYCI